jgi:heterodisulfide reductase subunit A
MKGEVIVIGGGPAGMEAASRLAKAGINVTLAEKEKDTGGNLLKWHHLFPDRRKSSEVLKYLSGSIKTGNIKLMPGTRITSINRKGNSLVATTNSGESIYTDAIVVATGFELFNSSRKEEYGYGIYENVITSADLEQMFNNGKLILHNGQVPEKFGIIHCVGSRDEKVGNLYCSKLCCVTAVKQAIEIKEHIPESKIFCFYMDMRMGGAYYEELYRESQEKYGISYIRGKVSEVGVDIENKLIVKVEDTLAGRPLKMKLDMVILMAGMEMSFHGQKLAAASGLNTGENKFFESADKHYGTNRSNIKGVFYAGSCTEPMNISDTISHARSAASEVVNYLNNGKQ